MTEASLRAPLVIAMLSLLASFAAPSRAAGFRQEPAPFRGSLDLLGGLESTIFRDGTEVGLLGRTGGKAELRLRPWDEAVLLIEALGEGVSGPTETSAVGRGGIGLRQGAGRRWTFGLGLRGGRAEGEDPFRDLMRGRVAGTVEHAIEPLLWILDAAWIFQYEDAFRVPLRNHRHSAVAGLTWIPRLSPLVLARLEGQFEKVDSTLPEESRIGPGAAVSALVETRAGLELSCSLQVRYDSYRDGAVSPVVLFDLRFEQRVNDGLSLVLDYSLNVNGEGGPAEEYVQHLFLAGLRIRTP